MYVMDSTLRTRDAQSEESLNQGIPDRVPSQSSDLGCAMKDRQKSERKDTS